MLWTVAGKECEMFMAVKRAQAGEERPAWLRASSRSDLGEFEDPNERLLNATKISAAARATWEARGLGARHVRNQSAQATAATIAAQNCLSQACGAEPAPLDLTFAHLAIGSPLLSCCRQPE